MKIKFESYPALMLVIEGLILAKIDYKITYEYDVTGTYERTFYILNLNDEEE